jgi:hypothetical protein
MSECFQEKFCRHFGVPADRYGAAMMQRTLYWHARWLAWLGTRDFLSADRSFIASVGRLTRRRDFSGEVMEFRDDARNLTFWRRTARLRVSSARMQALVRDVWSESALIAASVRPVISTHRSIVSRVNAPELIEGVGATHSSPNP